MKKEKLKEYCITYRSEIIITVQASSEEDALDRINKGEGEIEIFGDITPEFCIFEVEGIDFERVEE